MRFELPIVMLPRQLYNTDEVRDPFVDAKESLCWTLGRAILNTPGAYDIREEVSLGGMSIVTISVTVEEVKYPNPYIDSDIPF